MFAMDGARRGMRRPRAVTNGRSPAGFRDSGSELADARGELVRLRLTRR